MQNAYYVIQSRYNGAWEVRKSIDSDTYDLVGEHDCEKTASIITDMLNRKEKE